MLKKNLLFLMVIWSYYINTIIPSHNSSWPEKIIASMNIDQKVGQLFMIAACSDISLNKSFMKNSPYQLNPKEIESLIYRYEPGGIIFLGASNSDTQKKLTQHFQNISPIPLLIGQDLEWGLSMRHQNAIRFPKAMTLGALALSNEYLIYEIAKEIGKQCQSIGVHLNFAPVADVNTNPQNPIINMRSFGGCSHAVARKATLFMNGLFDAGIISCAKHFPGHGDTTTDSHHALPRINHTTKDLESIALAPFIHLINQGIPAIMAAHLNVPALDSDEKSIASLSAPIITDLLRKQYRFDGLIITDGLGMRSITDRYSPAQAAIYAIKAGTDILLCPVDMPTMHKALIMAIEEDIISIEEIDAHVLRILRAKEWALHNHEASLDNYDRHCPQAYALKKEAYRKAITHIRGNPTLTPGKKTHCFIIGTTHSLCADYLQENSTNVFIYYLINEHDIKKALALISCDENILLFAYPLSPLSMIKKEVSVQNYSIDIHKLCAQIAQKTVNAFVILFDSPYQLTKYNALANCILAYEDDEQAQYAAADVLLQKLIPTGIIPI